MVVRTQNWPSQHLGFNCPLNIPTIFGVHMFEWYALLAEEIRLANWLRYARNKKEVAHYYMAVL